MNRQDILQQLRAKRERGEPIIGGGAGTGISAKCEEAGGIDLIVIYNSGRYRMAGRGSLAGLMPYGNASVPVPWSACLRKSPLPRRYSSLCKFAISHETENPRHRNL